MKLTGKARKAGYAVAALGCALATSVAAPSAANASPGAYCGTYGNGYTMETVFIKQPPGCHDLNLTWVKWAGKYQGQLQNSSGTWVNCQAQVTVPANQSFNVPLCTDVVTGTPMRVKRLDVSSQGWNYHINY
jgi:hypothetical protein